MKTVDHSYEQALIMHDNVHIHVIMNIIMTPTDMRVKLGRLRLFILRLLSIFDRERVTRLRKKTQPR